MNRLWIRACAALLLAVMTLMFMTAPKAEPPMNVRASAFALIDSESGRLLFGKNENLRLPMASTTKIMTALVTLESCALDEMVGIPDEAVGAEGSSMYLERG
ncbi:MAG: D-alanyl-D-alanine carboxypeptidase, partial [Clostridia bacterium]|nr:D-alanyl-D-alanine carboxypeptidase [Clostridia bacterium]